MARGQGQTANGEGVPGGEDLLVPGRGRPGAADPQQLEAGAGQQLEFGAGGFGCLPAAAQVPAALEIGCFSEIVMAGEGLVFGGAQGGPDRIAVPEIVRPFPARAVGIQGAVEAPLGGLHLCQHPGCGLLGHPGETFLAGGGEGLGVEGQELAVVIEHLFEMGNFPALVHAIAIETTAQMIVEAAARHAPQGVAHHVQGLIVPCGGPVTQQAFQDVGLRKLGRAAETAVALVEGPAQLLAGEVQRDGGQLAGMAALGQEFRKSRLQALILFANGGALLVKEGRHPFQQLGKARQAVTGLGREIGAGEKGTQILGIEKHRQRPAPGTPGEQLVGGLIDAVQVRTLFPVHLDVDEQAVHERGGGRILEGFVGHDMAPVTGGVADGEQDGPVLAPRPLQGLGAPGVPVHGIVRMLAQVGTGLAIEAVHDCTIP